MVWSSAERNAERSCGENDFGPPVISPEERRSVIRLRIASVMPIDSSENGLPFGAITSAPALTQRLARGMSAVTTMSPGPARSAIQLSAADQAATRSLETLRSKASKQLKPSRSISLFLPRAERLWRETQCPVTDDIASTMFLPEYMKSSLKSKARK